MRQNRFLQALLILFGIAALFYVGAALYLPSSQKLIFGVDKRTGEVVRVENGITYLPWHRFYRMDFDRREGGSAVTKGQVSLRSRDGVPIRINYTLHFGVSTDQFPDPRTLVNDGWSAWLRSRVTEAVGAVLSQLPVDEIASPTADYGRQREVLREVVARYLSRSGLEVTSFNLESVIVDREALLNVKRAELRRNARAGVRRVAVITLEGADWELLKELSDDGRIPNLSRLIDEGATGVLESIPPAAAPMTWTTMMTGLTPDRHGVLGYFDSAGNQTPITSRSRNAPAVWEVAAAFGRPSLVVNGWTAWPPPAGVAAIASPVGGNQPLAYPVNLGQGIQRVHISENQITEEHLRRFITLPSSEENSEGKADEDPVPLLRKTLAETWSVHRSAVAGYRAVDPTLLVVNYRGTDVVNHLFSPFHPPYRQGVSYAEYRRYWPAVANFYGEMDRMIGEWLGILEPGTAVFVVSSHGFHWGSERLRAWSSRIGSLPQHRSSGVLVAWGEGVSPSNLRRQASVEDISPTILALLGLPASSEMKGNVLTWTFENIRPVEGSRIVRYDEYVDRDPAIPAAGVAAAAYRDEVQSIGHVIDPSQMSLPQFDEDGSGATTPLTAGQWGRYAWFNNHAIDLRQEKKRGEALAELQQAIELNPSRPTPYLNRAMILLEVQRYTDAEESLLEAVKHNLPNGEQYVLDLAAWYRENDMPTRAASFLARAGALFPQSYRIAANRGTALAAMQRYTEGTAELQRALGLQPSSTVALNALGNIAARREDWGSALDYWNRSLAVDPRQPEIRRAAEAVRSRL